MLNYLRGVQRRLSELVFPTNLFYGTIFNDFVEGLKSALDNKFSLQQVRGRITKSHNALTIQDICTISNSEILNPNKSTGYPSKLIFGVGLATGTRPTELWLLDVSQFKFEIVNGEPAIVYYAKTGSNLGES